MRFGKQVLSWGESTFIQGGINVFNPVDVSQLHVAGAELKEALLPVNMLWGSYNVTQNFSVEATYLLEFAQTNPDPSGTYFSTNDFATIGGTYASLPFGLVPQPVKNPQNYYPVCFGGAPSDNPAFGGSSTTSGALASLLETSCEQTVKRLPDHYPGEYDQFGVAAHYLADNLGGTEFAFYALQYSSRLPLISGLAVTTTIPNSAGYFVEYPDKIRMYGVSFNTQIEGPGVALQGELSYRPNQPLQIDAVELLFSGLTPLNALIPAPAERFVSQLGTYAPGQVIPGYTRNHVSQLQFTATKVFGPNNWFKADQIALVGEAGRYQGVGPACAFGPALQRRRHRYRRRPRCAERQSEQSADADRRVSDVVLLGLPCGRTCGLQQRLRYRIHGVAAHRLQPGRQRHVAGSGRQFHRRPQVGDARR